MKIMGKRQIGELEVGELVSTLIISEIVSIPIDTPEIPLMNAIIPLLFILSAEIIISFLKNKCGKLKKTVEGVPSFVIFDGKLNRAVLAENRISINEILAEMRTQGISDISDVRYCVLEATGKLSFFDYTESDVALPLIVDGEIDEENKTHLKIPPGWIEKILADKRKKPSDVFLMTANTSLEFNIIYKEENQ